MWIIFHTNNDTIRQIITKIYVTAYIIYTMLALLEKFEKNLEIILCVTTFFFLILNSNIIKYHLIAFV